MHSPSCSTCWTSPPPTSPPECDLNWKSALGIVLSAGLLVWTLRRTNRHPRSGRCSRSRTCRCSCSRHWWRRRSSRCARSAGVSSSTRWRPTFRSAPLWRSIAVGMMVNNIYPARLGEIARAYALTRETKRVSLTGAVASLAVDRVFDAIVLMLLLVSAMLAPEFPKGMVVGGQPVQRGAFVFGLGAIGLLVVSLRHRRDSRASRVRFYAAVVGRFAPRLVERGSAIIHVVFGRARRAAKPQTVRRGVPLGGGALAGERTRVLDRIQGRRASRCRSAPRIFCRGSSPSAWRFRRRPASSACSSWQRRSASPSTACRIVRRSVGRSASTSCRSFRSRVIGLYYFARLGLHFSDFKTPQPQPEAQ